MRECGVELNRYAVALNPQSQTFPSDVLMILILILGGKYFTLTLQVACFLKFQLGRKRLFASGLGFVFVLRLFLVPRRV